MHKITLAGSSHAMYVNLKDQKGNTLKSKNGLFQPRVVKFWRRAAAALKPDIVVDAGTNYGEIFLTAAYPEHAAIAVFEANAELIPYLSRSLAEHPNGRQIKLTNGFVTDKAEENVTFYVDKVRSGTSSGHHLGDRASKETIVRSTTIDHVFQDKMLAGGTLLFKMDVEGFEWEALRGMSGLLKSCTDAVGCIEFNRRYMISKGIDLPAFVEFLAEHFILYAPDPSGRLVPLPAPAYDSINAYFNADKLCNDLILLSNPELVHKLQP
ncbi:FkbM family methyltransferase [Paenibacillus sp. strain BS8-2]